MPESLSKFRVYPRGFLGVDIGRHYERTPTPFYEQINTHYYHAAIASQDGVQIESNPHVEGVYSTYIRNEVDVVTFDFRKKAIQTAFKAFGIPRFDVWVITQYKNPAAGYIHGEFLEDTIRFLKTGERNMSLENWAALIHITDEGNAIGTMPESIREFFDLDTQANIRNESNSMVVDVIQTWCSKVNGLEDLIGTLHILFGDV